MVTSMIAALPKYASVFGHIVSEGQGIGVEFASTLMHQSGGVPAMEVVSSRKVFTLLKTNLYNLNLRQNPHHYSSLRWVGSKGIQLVQDGFGADIYYNTNCKVAGQYIKYGVISIEKLINDMETWSTLYSAGRLHKPAKIVQNDARVEIAQTRNLQSAVRVAMLLLPEEFSEVSLFKQITSLSYIGDFRMRVYGEKPGKIDDIVEAQFERFQDVYRPIIQHSVDQLEYLDQSVESGWLRQDTSAQARTSIIRNLPLHLLEKITGKHLSETGRYTLGSDTNSLIADVAVDEDALRDKVMFALRDTVWRPSINQALKGILTAGPAKSFRYAAQKLSKGIGGK